MRYSIGVFLRLRNLYNFVAARVFYTQSRHNCESVFALSLTENVEVFNESRANEQHSLLV